MKLQPAIVTWFDAFGGDEGWSQLEEKEQRVVKTCGFIVPPNVDGYTTVILSYDTVTEDVGGFISIPNVNILEITELS